MMRYLLITIMLCGCYDDSNRKECGKRYSEEILDVRCVDEDGRIALDTWPDYAYRDDRTNKIHYYHFGEEYVFQAQPNHKCGMFVIPVKSGKLCAPFLADPDELPREDYRKMVIDSICNKEDHEDQT